MISATAPVRRVVFIAGLQHSGSTLLNLMLGAHSQCVAMGEVLPLLGNVRDKLDQDDRSCSCGMTVANCPYWSAARAELRRLGDADVTQRYRALLDVFADIFGADAVFADSSKNRGTLRIAARTQSVDLRVIHLLRDVRSWSTSQADLRQRQRASGHVVGTALERLLHSNSLGRFTRWHVANRRIEADLTQLGSRYLRIGYEPLALRPRQMAARLCEFLELPDEPGMCAIGNARSHIILGNPGIRAETEKRTTIGYDHRWLARNDWLFPSVILPHVMRYNRLRVYGESCVPGRGHIPGRTLRDPNDAAPLPGAL